MESDRLKWNRRFESADSYLGEKPSPFLYRELERIRQLVPGTAALDIACGEGRNSVFLARNGFRVTGLDISDVGLSKGIARAEANGVEVDFRRVDLDGYCITGQYDLILNFNFLMRDLITQEVHALTPGGLLLFDSILESPQLLATHNPDYLLRYGELRTIVSGYDGEILYYEESQTGEMPTARLLFRKCSPEAPPMPFPPHLRVAVP